MTKPRIAIPVPTSTDLDYNQRSWPQYASAVEQAGGAAVEVPLTLSLSAIARVMEGCQGILLPGSPADVDPRRYGQEPVEACAAADPARESIDEALLRDAHDLGKPILAICFGTQMLNVWRGGTLVQDLTVLPVNHAAGGSVAVAHAASVVAESLLGGLIAEDEAPEVGGFRRLPINSSHHQAVGIPGEGLRIVARCPQDGVIEAVEGLSGFSDGDTGGSDAGGHFVLGVQWHPERSCAISAASREIFGRFVGAATAFRAAGARSGRGFRVTDFG
jgi:putative glutamine amidotransferase